MVAGGSHGYPSCQSIPHRFGAGGGEGRRNDQHGGGGMVSASPIGALEITPESTSFTRFTDWERCVRSPLLA